MTRRPSDPVEPRDADNRRRIVSDLDRNMLVEAGAGSGKTHMMAARMAAGIAAGTYAVEQMAAVTFTRKAAAELRGRFQAALENELSRTADPDRIGRVRDALANLERFFAGTIHAFCAQLLRERPVEAGVSPGFGELDEVEDAKLRGQVWRDFLAQARVEGNPQVLELSAAGVKPSQLDKAFETVCGFEEVEFPSGDAEPPEVEKTWRALDAFWALVEARLPPSPAPDAKCKALEKALLFRGAMRIARLQPRQRAKLAELLAVWESNLHVTMKWWEGGVTPSRVIRDELQAQHAAFRTDFVVPFLEAWRQYVYRLAVTLLTEARSFAAAARRRQNTLNYGDLLNLTAGLLRRDADVRAALQQKYRWLFVDEFQDTDPVQAEVIFMLAAAPVGARAPVRGSSTTRAKTVDWRTLPLRKGALFVVGDPKQSIYRFRRADIEVYNQVRARIEESGRGELLSLTTNFRSVAPLCEWANEVFVTRFPKDPTPHSPRFAPLDAIPGAVVGAPALHTLIVPGTVEQSNVPEAEAARIAAFIRAEIDAHRRSPGDFLVLTRKKKALATYADALEALAVPMEVTGAGAFGTSPVVAHFARLLTALSDPQDMVSLVAVLRGPLFGVSDRELFRYRQTGGWLSVFSALKAGDDEAADAAGGGVPRVPPFEALPVALDTLGRWYRWTRQLPVAAALDRILEDSGYLALAVTTPEGSDGADAGDLLHAVDRVRQVIERGQTLADAAADIEAACAEPGKQSSDIDSLPLEPGRTGVVRVMNLHKAKGLEAPVVFLADPCSGFAPWVDVRVIRNGPSAVGYFVLREQKGEWNRVLLAKPAGWDEHEKEEKEHLKAEESRLLYVAATRAKEMLVVGRWAGTGGRGTRAWAGLDPFLAAAVELPPAAPVGSRKPVKVDLSPRAHAQAAAERAAAHALLHVHSWSATSVTAEARHISRMARAAEGPALPDSVMPGGPLPDSDMPGGSLPDSDMPGGSLPDSDMPGGPLPDSVMPGGPLPDSDMPGGSLPDSDMPGGSLPGSGGQDRVSGVGTGSDAAFDGARDVDPGAAREAAPPATADTPGRRADAGAAWGTLVHGLLEHAMRHAGASRDDLRRLAMWLTVEEPELRLVVEEAIDTVELVANAAFWDAATAASERHEEVPFARAVQGERGPQVLTGTMDLAYLADAEWRIVDYKTDEAGAAPVDSRYQSQLDQYREAWRGFTKQPVSTELVWAGRKT